MHQHPSSTYMDVVALVVAKSDPDTPSFKEALSGDHTVEFNETMTKEVNALQNSQVQERLRVLRLFPQPGQ
eukprot:9409899-Ditylum_brightwellii.AAC.1